MSRRLNSLLVAGAAALSMYGANKAHAEDDTIPAIVADPSYAPVLDTLFEPADTEADEGTAGEEANQRNPFLPALNPAGYQSPGATASEETPAGETAPVTTETQPATVGEEVPAPVVLETSMGGPDPEPERAGNDTGVYVLSDNSITDSFNINSFNRSFEVFSDWFNNWSIETTDLADTYRRIEQLRADLSSSIAATSSQYDSLSDAVNDFVTRIGADISLMGSRLDELSSDYQTIRDSLEQECSRIADLEIMLEDPGLQFARDLYREANTRFGVEDARTDMASTCELVDTEATSLAAQLLAGNFIIYTDNSNSEIDINASWNAFNAAYESYQEAVTGCREATERYDRVHDEAIDAVYDDDSLTLRVGAGLETNGENVAPTAEVGACYRVSDSVRACAVGGFGGPTATTEDHFSGENREGVRTEEATPLGSARAIVDYVADGFFVGAGVGPSLVETAETTDGRAYGNGMETRLNPDPVTRTVPGVQGSLEFGYCAGPICFGLDATLDSMAGPRGGIYLGNNPSRD